MTNFTTFRNIIELWGKSREGLAVELPGVSAAQVSKWWQRDSIPAEYWASLLLTEKARSNGISAALLTSLAAREHEVRT